MEDLRKKYIGALQSLQDRLTKARKIDEALKVKTELGKVKEEIARLAAEKAKANAPPVRNLAKLKPAEFDGSPMFHQFFDKDDAVHVDGKKYAKEERIYAHAHSTLTWKFESPVTSFSSIITVMVHGRDRIEGRGKVVFRVLSRGKVLYESSSVESGEHVKVDIKFKPTRALTLVTDDLGDQDCDHGFWVQPKAQ